MSRLLVFITYSCSSRMPIYHQIPVYIKCTFIILYGFTQVMYCGFIGPSVYTWGYWFYAIKYITPCFMHTKFWRWSIRHRRSRLWTVYFFNESERSAWHLCHHQHKNQPASGKRYGSTDTRHKLARTCLCLNQNNVGW